MSTSYHAAVVVRLVLATILAAYSSYCLYAKQVFVPSLSASQTVITEHYYLGVSAFLVLALYLVASCIFYDAFRQNRAYSGIALGVSICLMTGALILG